MSAPQVISSEWCDSPVEVDLVVKRRRRPAVWWVRSAVGQISNLPSLDQTGGLKTCLTKNRIKLTHDPPFCQLMPQSVTCDTSLPPSNG